MQLLNLMTSLRIGKKEIFYLIIMGVAAFFSFVKNMAFGVYLNPTEMGYYSIAVTIASYGVFFQLGLMSGLNRELPVCLGAQKKEYAAGLVGETTLSVAVLQMLGLMIFLLVISLSSFGDYSVKSAFILGGLLSCFGAFGQIVILRLRAEQRVLDFSLLQLVNAIGILILGIFAIKVWDYKGAIIATILVNILGFFIVSKIILNPVNYRYFKLKEVLYLGRIGLPLMCASVLLNFQISMDRLFLLKYRTVEEIGIYQMGILPLTMGIVLSSIVGQYVGPKLLFRYGQGKSPSFVFYCSILVSLVTIGVLLLSWPLFFLVVKYAVHHWLPAYEASLPLMSIFYLGAVFTAATIEVLFSAVNRQIISFYISLVVVLIVFVGNVLVTYFDKTIEWYAYVNIFGQILVFILTVGISLYMIRIPHLESKIFNPAE